MHVRGCGGGGEPKINKFDNDFPVLIKTDQNVFRFYVPMGNSALMQVGNSFCDPNKDHSYLFWLQVQHVVPEKFLQSYCSFQMLEDHMNLI